MCVVTNETIEEDEDEEEDVSIETTKRTNSQFPDNSQRDDKFPSEPKTASSPIKLRRIAAAAS